MRNRQLLKAEDVAQKAAAAQVCGRLVMMASSVKALHLHGLRRAVPWLSVQGNRQTHGV